MRVTIGGCAPNTSCAGLLLALGDAVEAAQKDLLEAVAELDDSKGEVSGG